MNITSGFLLNGHIFKGAGGVKIWYEEMCGIRGEIRNEGMDGWVMEREQRMTGVNHHHHHQRHVLKNDSMIKGPLEEYSSSADVPPKNNIQNIVFGWQVLNQSHQTILITIRSRILKTPGLMKEDSLNQCYFRIDFILRSRDMPIWSKSLKPNGNDHDVCWWKEQKDGNTLWNKRYDVHVM